jgi:hypothetical protein
MRLIDFLRDFSEALEDAKEKANKQSQQPRRSIPKVYRPKRHR